MQGVQGMLYMQGMQDSLIICNLWMRARYAGYARYAVYARYAR